MIATPRQEIEKLVAQAVQALFGERAARGPYVRPCLDARHGDFQTNAALVQAAALKGTGEKANPRELAQKIAASIDLSSESAIVLPGEVAGPGFVNFRLNPRYCAAQVLARASDTRLGCGRASKPRTVVLDFSGPNVAKEMHVGHLRSTILGDALARAYRFLGHKVITDNHIGDWGTQFGMVIFAYKKYGDAALLESEPLEHLENLYRRGNEECKADPVALDSARAELAKLQKLDPENIALWQHFVDVSRRAMEALYVRLDVTFDFTLGESFFNEMLPGIVSELIEKGIARPSEGAICVFFEDIEALKDQPFLIQKSDGAYLYATTDLATLRYRYDRWNADQIIYVTDGRQQTHFQQLFATALRWGFERVRLDHVWFGKVLGEDRQPLRTRDGGTIKLKALLDESEVRARAILGEKRPDLPESEQQNLARVLGIGAVKYADMAQNRNLDYIFDWDKLLAFDGNTAPYLINAYVRTQSLFRKAANDPSVAAFLAEDKDTDKDIPIDKDNDIDISTKIERDNNKETGLVDLSLLTMNGEGGSESKVSVKLQQAHHQTYQLRRDLLDISLDSLADGLVFEQPTELALAKKLLDFGDSLQMMIEECRPHFLCVYLFEIATMFHQFWEHCPVLDVMNSERVKLSRLALAQLTGRTLKLGLHLLGIEVVNRM